MATEKTKRGWHADRQRVSGVQPHELEYIRKHHCYNYVTIKQVREVFETINDGAVMRDQLMEELEKAGLIYHDPVQPATPSDNE